MARIRTIKPEFWTHPIMGRAEDSVKCLALALLNHADDEGYFLAAPVLVRSYCRPFDDSSGITTVLLRELCRIGWVSIREHGEIGEIGFVINFATHQVVNKPKVSKLKKYFDSGIDTVSIPDNSGRGTTGKGMEGNGKELSSSSSPLPIHQPIAGDTDCFETTKMGIFEFRNHYQRTFNQVMPGGLNHRANELSQQYPKETLESAFEITAANGGKSLRYLEEVLKGKPKTDDLDSVIEEAFREGA